MREIKFEVFDSHLNVMQKDAHKYHEFIEWMGRDRFKIRQFIGLEDSVGKEIYNGDIIHSDYSGGRPCRHVIKYNNDTASFVAENLDGLDACRKTDGGTKITKSWLTVCNKIVIGNIYENPTLLTEK